ncbi:DUF928 domain-containing protein [Lusitaniella coriacea LEGE 07157]|uniref:DUF928 domain-containing protein n=1 Tax=Lusitaniella coriacea LEGE 07157 TaxID=945747 RepID=A0A8J7DZL1_9CYAN|nr:DUF928 domain-containing protein [Lusitaniella coriacea]MBE9118283.1 DUF928 domain-containing protein [Lusitaniella coriacea LEGE 07157]
MIFRQFISSASLAAVFVSPMLCGFTYLSSSSTTLSSRSTLVSINFPSSRRTGPARTASGGARSECSVKGINDGVTPITVLMPEDNMGTTETSDPNLLLYMSENNLDGADVIILDPADESEVYVQRFNLPDNPSQKEGVVKFPLKNANLEPGKTYEWSFSPFCFNEEGEPQYPNISVMGLFERKPLSSEDRTKLGRANTPAEAAEIYAQAGVWNETLALVEKLRQTKPEEWVNLLNSVGLDDIASAPYIGEATAMSDPDSDLDNNTVVRDSSSPEEDKTNNAVEPIRGLW